WRRNGQGLGKVSSYRVVIEWFKNILNPKGDQSSTRLVLLWLVVNATLMGWYIIRMGTEYASESVMVMGGVTTIAGVLKYIQKREESKK
ncbi:MAG: hypothetical protein ACPG5W_09740, partial [Flavobacteriales bacterium]